MPSANFLQYLEEAASYAAHSPDLKVSINSPPPSSEDFARAQQHMRRCRSQGRLANVSFLLWLAPAAPALFLAPPAWLWLSWVAFAAPIVWLQYRANRCHDVGPVLRDLDGTGEHDAALTAALLPLLELDGLGSNYAQALREQRRRITEFEAIALVAEHWKAEDEALRRDAQSLAKRLDQALGFVPD